MKHEGKMPAHGAVPRKGGGVVTGAREPGTASRKHPEHGPNRRKPFPAACKA